MSDELKIGVICGVFVILGLTLGLAFSHLGEKENQPLVTQIPNKENCEPVGTGLLEIRGRNAYDVIVCKRLTPNVNSN